MPRIIERLQSPPAKSALESQLATAELLNAQIEGIMSKDSSRQRLIEAPIINTNEDLEEDKGMFPPIK